MRDYILTMLGALSVCVIHHHFIAKPHLERLKSLNKV